MQFLEEKSEICQSTSLQTMPGKENDVSVKELTNNYTGHFNAATRPFVRLYKLILILLY